MFRAVALGAGPTVRIPRDTSSFNLKYIDGVQMVHEEEAQGSPLLRLKHADLMPVLDGDIHNMKMPSKGKDCVKVVSIVEFMLA